LSIASELDDQTGLGVCHCNIATTFEMLGKIEEAADQNEKVRHNVWDAL
jgi:maleate cis-trans isomerase